MSVVRKEKSKCIKALVEAILAFQEFDNLEEITKSMISELERQFEDVKEKGGKKKVWRLDYYPNGLCIYIAPNKHDRHDIILKPWNNSTETELELNLNYIKRNFPLWYYQIRTYLKHKVAIPNCNLSGLLDTLKRYNTLSQEEKKLINLSNINSAITHRMFIIQKTLQYAALTEDEIKLVINYVAGHNQQYYGYDRYIDAIAKDKKLPVPDFYKYNMHSYHDTIETYHNDMLNYIKSVDNPVQLGILKRMKVRE